MLLEKTGIIKFINLYKLKYINHICIYVTNKFSNKSPQQIQRKKTERNNLETRCSKWKLSCWAFNLLQYKEFSNLVIKNKMLRENVIEILHHMAYEYTRFENFSKSY